MSLELARREKLTIFIPILSFINCLLLGLHGFDRLRDGVIRGVSKSVSMRY